MTLRTAAQRGAAYSGGVSAAGSYTASTQALNSAAAAAEQTRDQMGSHVNALLSALHALSTASWAGPARGAYNTAQLQWSDAHRRLMTALDSIAEGLRTSGRNYEQTESANAGDITRAASGLNQ